MTVNQPFGLNEGKEKRKKANQYRKEKGSFYIASIPCNKKLKGEILIGTDGEMTLSVTRSTDNDMRPPRRW